MGNGYVVIARVTFTILTILMTILNKTIFITMIWCEGELFVHNFFGLMLYYTCTVILYYIYIYIFVLDFCQSIEWKWICRTKSNMPVVPIESDWIACERKGKQYVWKCLIGNFYLKSHTNIAYSRTKTSILLTHWCPIGCWWRRTVTERFDVSKKLIGKWFEEALALHLFGEHAHWYR